MNFQDCLTAFLLYSKPKASIMVYERIADQYFRTWEAWPTFEQVENWYQSLHRTPHHANKSLNLLRAMFNWAERRQYYTGSNPCRGIERHKTHSRERVMTSQEVALVLNCLDMIPPKLSALLIVLLLTGCRLSEARTMEKRYVNMATGQWHQPKTKNGRPHTSYLPLQARQAIAKLSPKGDYIFNGVYDHCWSRPGVEKVWSQVRGALGLSDVRLHDFRRTLATHLYRETKDDYLVKRCINHVNTSITAIYVRISYEEVAKALQAQADRFYALEKGVPYETASPVLPASVPVECLR